MAVMTGGLFNFQMSLSGPVFFQFFELEGLVSLAVLVLPNLDKRPDFQD